MIFNKNPKKNDKDIKFAGAHIPLQLHEYLTMYSMTVEQSKSILILNLLEAWQKETSKTTPVETLIELLKEKALIGWKKSKGKPGVTLKKFCNEVRKELTKRGIPETIITKIDKYIKNETD